MQGSFPVTSFSAEMGNSGLSLIAQLVKNPPAIAGDPGWIPGWGRSPGEGIGYALQYSGASLVAQLVKNLPAMWETWVQSLGCDDSLEKGMATHSSILAWRTPWTVSSMGSQRARTQLSDFHFHTPNSPNRHVQNIPSNSTIIHILLKTMEYAPR